MTHKSRYSRVFSGTQSSHALHRKPLISEPPLLPISINPFHFQSSSTHYNTKEGKFFSPFTGTIPIPRSTFQLSVPEHSKISESNFAPMKITNSMSEAKLIKDMQNMIPTAVHEKKDMKLCLRTSIRQMKTLKINPDDLVIVGGLIPQMPYCRANSRIFFKHCKRGDKLEVEVMLEQDKYLAQVFDPMRMTALHWTALRGYAEIASLLLKNTAFVDAIDCVFFI